MKKHTSEEAYYERLRNLAQTKKTSIKESRTLGTLVDYKRAADGVAYGIIKEQHHYYVKKGGLKENPSVSDFAYIGGLENITGFQYKSLSEADKQRNMMFHTINEAVTSKPSKTGSKKRLNEDKAGQEIDNAESKLGDLDAATASAEVPAEMPAPEGGVEMEAGLDAMPTDSPEGGATPDMGGEGDAMPDMGGAEGGEEMGGAEGGEETAPEGEETPDMGGAEGEDDNKSISVEEIEKMTGKLTNLIRKTDIEPSMVKSLVNSLLTSFEDKLDNDEIEIEDKQEMVDKIMGRTSDNAEADLEATMPDEEPADAEVAEAKCSECGTFAQYAESRGYGSAESLMECGEEEVGNLVSGYANAHGDGQNDGDLEGVALVVKIVNPEILNQLRGDYGHEEYADKLQPHVDGMNESSEEDNIAQLNELFGGLKAAFNKVGGDVKSVAQQAGQAVGKKAQQIGGAVKGATQQASQAVGQYAQGVKQQYHTGELPSEIKKLEGIAADLGKQIAALNSRLQKAGKEPVGIRNIITTIQNNLTGKAGAANLSKFAAESFDPANVETQPMDEVKVAQKAGTKLKPSAPVKPITEEEEPDGDENIAHAEPDGDEGIGFAPDGQSLGAAMVKPDGAATTGVDININPDKSVNISMNETEIKVRKYIREQLEIKAGLKKASLNENKKSETLKKLDKIIDEQFKLFESSVKKKDNVEEGAIGDFTKKISDNFTIKGKFAKLDPNNVPEVNKLFVQAFRNILTNPNIGLIGREARETTPQQRYELLKQYVENNGGTLRSGKNGIQFAPETVKNAAIKNPFSGGGTQGKTSFGGTIGK
jgi:hypothetical protein